MIKNKTLICLVSAVAAGLLLNGCKTTTSTSTPASSTPTPVSSTSAPTSTSTPTSSTTTSIEPEADATTKAWGYLAFSDTDPDIDFIGWTKTGTIENAANGIHMKGVSNITNYIKVTSDRKFLTVAAGGYDCTVAPKLKVSFGTNVLTAAGYTLTEIPLATSCRAIYNYNYDLSSYVNTKGYLTIEQTVATAEDMLLNKATLREDNKYYAPIAADDDLWLERDDMVADWQVAGNYRDGVGEGMDVNSWDNSIISSIDRYVTLESTKGIFKLRGRLFHTQDGDGSDGDPCRKICPTVRVNGTLINPIDSDKPAVMDSRYDGDSFVYFFDLSAYKGKSVNIGVAAEAYPDMKPTGHCVIQGLSFQETADALDATGSYGGETISSWKYRYSGLDYDATLTPGCARFNAWDWGKMSQQFNVPAATKKMVVTYVPHAKEDGHDGDNNIAKWEIAANGYTINPVGSDTFYTEVSEVDGDPDVTTTYDLTAFSGKSVMLQFFNYNDCACITLIRTIAFTA